MSRSDAFPRADSGVGDNLVPAAFVLHWAFVGNDAVLRSRAEPDIHAAAALLGLDLVSDNRAVHTLAERREDLDAIELRKLVSGNQKPRVAQTTNALPWHATVEDLDSGGTACKVIRRYDDVCPIGIGNLYRPRRPLRTIAHDRHARVLQRYCHCTRGDFDEGVVPNVEYPSD